MRFIRGSVMHSSADLKLHKLALIELKQDQGYWEAKWHLQNHKAKIEYINFHTADRLRDVAIEVDMDIDDLMVR